MTDYKSLFYNLDERYRQLQKKFNAREEELKHFKVAQRKTLAGGPPARRPSHPRHARLSLGGGSGGGGGFGAQHGQRPSSGGGGGVYDASAAPLPPALRRPSTTGSRMDSVFARHFESPSHRRGGDNKENVLSLDEVDSAAGSPFDDAGADGDDSDYAAWRRWQQQQQQTRAKVPPLSPGAVTGDAPGEDGEGAGTPHEHVGLPAPSAVERDAAQAGEVSRAARWGSGELLPDPSLVWGAEGGVRNYVAASALYHANESLRRKLADASATLQTQARELGDAREASRQALARLDDMTQQMQQAVRERDLSLQKYSSAQQTIAGLERTLRDRVGEEEKVRFGLESQIGELRSRLIVGADSNALLSRDVQALLAETKDRTQEAMALRSKLALAESALASQRSTNESLLVELRALNNQLMDERKRVLLMAREAQAAQLGRERVADLEARAAQALEEKRRLESEHVALMGDFVRVTDDALRHARREVRADIEDWRRAAQHWEEVAQLLYRDVAERTRAHQRCRDECEEAKAQRDAAAVELRQAREQLAHCNARLEVVWPSHATDTKDLTADEILNVFGRRRRHRRFGKGKGSGGAAPDSSSSSSSPSSSPAAGANAEEGSDDSGLLDFRYGAGTLAEQVRELQEANASLRAELERQRLVNDLLQERLDGLARDKEATAAEVADERAALQKREAAGRRLVERHLDRIGFLEAQVHSLRGYPVAAGAALDDLGSDENALELFLGQLVAAESPSNAATVPDAFAQVFCTVDFLLHETVTSPTITGLNGFFDTSVAFCISMDTMLLYYLQTRDLVVQLHRLRRRDGSDGAGEPDYETIAEGRLNLTDIVAAPDNRTAARPTLKGHVRLLSRGPDRRLVASLEYSLAARVPYTPAFRRLIDHTFPLVEDGAGQAAGDGSGDDNTGRRYQASALRQWLSSSASSSRSREGSSLREGGPGGGRPRLSGHGSSLVDETSSSAYRSAASAPQGPPSAAAPDTPTPAVRALRLCVHHVSVPPGTRPPRLGCYYALPALGATVRLPAPPAPLDTVAYDGCPGADSVFPLPSPEAAAAAAREPVTLFLVDEDALAAGRDSVWAMAVCEWLPALRHPGVPATHDLAVVRQQRVLPGAAVRVTVAALTGDNENGTGAGGAFGGPRRNYGGDDSAGGSAGPYAWTPGATPSLFSAEPGANPPPPPPPEEEEEQQPQHPFAQQPRSPTPSTSAADAYPQAPRPLERVTPAPAVDTTAPRWENTLPRPAPPAAATACGTTLHDFLASQQRQWQQPADTQQQQQPRQPYTPPSYGRGTDIGEEMLRLEYNGISGRDRTF